ncbi:glycosyltransferase family 4 protein [Spongiibacter tropicus]|uniref:glycosyltransferase family 4 protein n=1 Tax=Spongiibacter tropicus TaxID=454602 RepID=UPI0035BE5C57
MKIIVHDYAGHPFQADLSRELARRGYAVEHVYFSGDQGPKGNLECQENDPVSLSFRPISIEMPYSKSNFFVRRKGDLAYGRKIAAVIRESRPDIVISGNSPTEIQEYVLGACKDAGARFYYWIQDFYSIAVAKLLAKKLPVLGLPISLYYKFLERRQLALADGVISITESFGNQLSKWKIGQDKVHVIPNWGAISEIPRLAQEDSTWGSDNQLDERDIILYSGTLGMKHNPHMLVTLAREMPNVQVVVAASGVGVDALKHAKQEGSVENLILFPLQDFNIFPQMLAAASVFVAFIESDAGEFSVPSKVLSYLCAGRPVVLAAPEENLAAKIVEDNCAGLTVDAGDVAGFVRAVNEVVNDKDMLMKMSDAARSYAEANFHIFDIASRFERVFGTSRVS